MNSDTIKMPDPDDKGNLDVKSGPPSYIAPGGGDTIKSDSAKSTTSGSGAKSDTAKPDSSNPKSDSRTAGGTLKKGGASSKSRLDDIPEEASQYIDDPSRQLTSYIL